MNLRFVDRWRRNLYSDVSVGKWHAKSSKPQRRTFCWHENPIIWEWFRSCSPTKRVLAIACSRPKWWAWKKLNCAQYHRTLHGDGRQTGQSVISNLIEMYFFIRSPKVTNMQRMERKKRMKRIMSHSYSNAMNFNECTHSLKYSNRKKGKETFTFLSGAQFARREWPNKYAAHAVRVSPSHANRDKWFSHFPPFSHQSRHRSNFQSGEKNTGSVWLISCRHRIFMWVVERIKTNKKRCHGNGKAAGSKSWVAAEAPYTNCTRKYFYSIWMARESCFAPRWRIFSIWFCVYESRDCGIFKLIVYYRSASRNMLVVRVWLLLPTSCCHFSSRKRTFSVFSLSDVRMDNSLIYYYVESRNEFEVFLVNMSSHIPHAHKLSHTHTQPEALSC